MRRRCILLSMSLVLAGQAMAQETSSSDESTTYSSFFSFASGAMQGLRDKTRTGR